MTDLDQFIEQFSAAFAQRDWVMLSALQATLEPVVTAAAQQVENEHQRQEFVQRLNTLNELVQKAAVQVAQARDQSASELGNLNQHRNAAASYGEHSADPGDGAG